MFFKVYVIVGVVVCEYSSLKFTLSWGLSCVNMFFKVYVIVGVVVCEYVL